MKLVKLIIKKRRLIPITIFLLYIALPLTVWAEYPCDQLTTKPEAQQFIKQMSKKYRFDPAYLSDMLNHAHYNSQVLNDINRPEEAMPWYDYQALFITPRRVAEGVKFWHRYHKVLAMAERHFGVSPAVIVAILGIESRYGQKMGRYRVIDALATLAFYSSTRADFFKKELGDFFIMAREKKLNPLAIYGSYAGAMGMPQFMPSSYLYYAVGFSNEQRPNLFKNGSDAIFSVANFLMQKGWKRNGPIAARAIVNGSHYYNKITKADSRKPKEPNISLKTLAHYGVQARGSYSLSQAANLMRVQGRKKAEYWLGFHNFYVITRYNNSDLYALAVYQLGQKIQAGWDAYQRNVAAKSEEKKTAAAKKDVKKR